MQGCMLETVFFVQTGEYAVGWNAEITPLGYKLLSLSAGANGITPIKQTSV